MGFLNKVRYLWSFLSDPSILKAQCTKYNIISMKAWLCPTRAQAASVQMKGSSAVPNAIYKVSSHIIIHALLTLNKCVSLQLNFNHKKDTEIKYILLKTGFLASIHFTSFGYTSDYINHIIQIHALVSFLQGFRLHELLSYPLPPYFLSPRCHTHDPADTIR